VLHITNGKVLNIESEVIMNELTKVLKIKTLKCGQPRPYADSEYEYEIEVDGMNEFEVKQYCTKVLNPCNQTQAQWDTHDANSYFQGYYTFYKIDENCYKYTKHVPFCD
jgi:hypothetical protein